MNRRDFGTWGSELSRDDFAYALAAVGVVAADGALLPLYDSSPEELADVLRALLTGEGAPRLVTWSGWWIGWLRADGDAVSAPELADAWRTAYEQSPGVRLEVQHVESADPFWIVSQLSLPAVGAASVHVQVEPPGEVGWEWPLRVGLLDDEPSRRLRDSIGALWKEHEWACRLTRLVSPAQGDDCDLLLLPYALEDALAAVLSAGAQLRADCVAVLGESRFPPDRRWRLVAAMRAAVRTSGVALVPGIRSAPESWLLDLVREISHAAPLDVALFAAQRSWVQRLRPEDSWAESDAASRGEGAPVLAASRALVEFTSLADRASAMAERMQSPEMRERVIKIPPGSSIERFGLHGRQKMGDVGEWLTHRARDVGFFRESDMATVIAEISGPADAAAPEDGAAPGEPPRRAADRYIQAQVFDARDVRSPERLERAFRPGAPHIVSVRIGMSDEEWLAPSPDSRFPDEELPRNAEQHVLTVVLTAAGLLEEPLVGEIRLPRDGNSSTQTFPLFVPETAERVDARILVMHANRVLQTARLRGAVGEGEGGEGRIEVSVEARVRRDLSDLGGRSRFDGALVLNHTGDHDPGITKACEGYAEFFVSRDLPTLIDWIDARLSQVAQQRKKFEGPADSPDQVALLRDLARKGAQLYRHIVKDGIGDGPLARGERIQVISLVAEARLPVELIYDRKQPAEDAQLCAGAIEGLRSGGCRACARPDDGSVVCPFGFWGVSKILERHAHTPDHAKTYERDFVFLDTDPGRRSGALDVLRAGVCGWTQRVPDCIGEEELAEITGAMLDATGKPARPADSWEGLEEVVKERLASLILLLVHTDEVPNDIEQRAELGDGHWKIVSDIDGRYVRPDGAGPPLVVMLGCESGAPKVDFLGFASQLRDAGAAIVLTAGATIHTVHAVPAAASFLRALAALPPDGSRTLGEVMRTVRREMLAEGNPMVLCLSVFGDADWRLAPTTGPGGPPRLSGAQDADLDGVLVAGAR